MTRGFCSVSTKSPGRSVSLNPTDQGVGAAEICHNSADEPRADAFIRDELSKGRYDPAITKSCFEMLLELFGRTLKLDLGEHDGKKLVVQDVC